MLNNVLLLSLIGNFILLNSEVWCKQPSEDETDRIVVHTSRGTISGFHLNNVKRNDFYLGEADVFLGIPYAVPPVDELRFQRSKLIEKFAQEPLEANRYGKICPQINGDIDAVKYDTGMDEDCLTLNIIAPNVSDRVNKYPVMVYIHGGALKFGNVAEWGYRGIVSNLVRRGVVWVSFNYRLGVFGFFTTNTDEFPPNRGIWDQIIALRWVQAEIKNFGGDKNRVTLIGHSAGACSASSLALTPVVEHSLFHSMILQSCTAEICFDQLYGKFTQSLDRAEQICNIDARNQGWTSANVLDMKDCLAKLNHTQISAYDAEPLRWNVVLDDELFTDVPMKMRWRQMPILMGSARDEFALYEQWSLARGQSNLSDYTPQKAIEKIRYWTSKIYGDQLIDDILELIFGVYGKPNETSDNVDCIKYMTRVLSDMIYIRAVGEEAEAHLNSGNPNVWLWHLNVETDYFSFYRFPDYKPSFHGIELYLLMQPEKVWLTGNQWGQHELELSNMLATEFTKFASAGKPSAQWERTRLDRMNYWLIGERVNEIENRNFYGGKKFLFWKALSRLMRKFDEKSSSVDKQQYQHTEL